MPSALRCLFSAAVPFAFISSTWAQADSNALAACAKIGAAADRLVCYDKLAGRAAPEAPITPASATSPEPTSKLAPVDTAAAKLPQPASEGSLMSKFWELDDTDKRGVFNFTGYRPNFILPLHLTSHVNRAPQSPTQPAFTVPHYRNIEAKIQLSLRTKLLQEVPLVGGDLWGGYTQQSLWQVWNHKDSKPFRNTDYEAELMYVKAVPQAWRDWPFGWTWRYGQFAIAHQSNGQSDPLSRSWNRIYVGTGLERGDWSLVGRINHRLREDITSDNNPDLVDYRGRGDLQLSWSPGPYVATLLYRTTFKDIKRGALQFEWSAPVYPKQPNGIRWFVQVFTGYGETLTDYNFRQTSIGAGLSFMQF